MAHIQTLLIFLFGLVWLFFISSFHSVWYTWGRLVFFMHVLLIFHLYIQLWLYSFVFYGSFQPSPSSTLRFFLSHLLRLLHFYIHPGTQDSCLPGHQLPWPRCGPVSSSPSGSVSLDVSVPFLLSLILSLKQEPLSRHSILAPIILRRLVSILSYLFFSLCAPNLNGLIYPTSFWGSF